MAAGAACSTARHSCLAAGAPQGAARRSQRLVNFPFSFTFATHTAVLPAAYQSPRRRAAGRSRGAARRARSSTRRSAGEGPTGGARRTRVMDGSMPRLHCSAAALPAASGRRAATTDRAAACEPSHGSACTARPPTLGATHPPTLKTALPLVWLRRPLSSLSGVRSNTTRHTGSCNAYARLRHGGQQEHMMPAVPGKRAATRRLGRRRPTCRCRAPNNQSSADCRQHDKELFLIEIEMQKGREGC